MPALSKSVTTKVGVMDVDMWMSDKVSPSGLVKQTVEKQGVQVLLQSITIP
jgi:hypothetical protein